MDYSYFKTEISKRRQPATTRELTKIAYAAPKSTISLAEGMPNEETFPFTEISVKLYDGSSFILDESELGAALQYIPTQGYPPLVQALREFQRMAHAPPLWESRDILVVSGSQDGLSKTLEAIIGTGDPILVPDSFYPGVEVVITPHKAELVTISQDDDGPIPEVLREILKNRAFSGAKMPKIMYINSTGTNPTGIIIPLERRKEIYRIACEYNFLILDDDPYHFIHFDKVILYNLLKIWGYDGLMEHYMRLRYFYKARRDVISMLARKHLNGLADFNVPKGGFFLWIKIRGIKNTWKMIMQRGITDGVIMAPGAAFMKDSLKPCNAIRASFAKASYEEMELAMRRLAQLIRAELAENYFENVNT
ncbi:kynurenine/alpha-aminoadipate aminotransferase, mitochondrial isoform X2 [Polyergus mexicanus]|uniref:kynurenine/alpha-aminoadipate aminotransferase, mitochondrial isoform X2 n=1 Tax=Polyergus mexicanus TaxID=615972 RepID=UPI0038B44DEA